MSFDTALLSKGTVVEVTRSVLEAGRRILEVYYPVLSEEGAEVPYETRKGWKRFWLVDPLDGTKEFIKRNGEFTVNVALIEDNRPVAGWVYLPVPDVLYIGIEGEGAWKTENAGKGCSAAHTPWCLDWSGAS